MPIPVTIAVIEGTVRDGRRSANLARWIADFGVSFEDVEIVYVDPRDLNFPGDGDAPEAKDARYTEIVSRADGFLIVTPEYNHSFPGSLKRMLDSEDDLYYHKAVAICGASNGDWGGARAVESLIPVLKAFGLSVARNGALFTHIDTMFDEQGNMKTEFIEKYERTVRGVYEDLLWLTRALKQARNQQ